ncbi:MAG TPA: hypothetical protein VJH92_04635 [Candidatus Nanoarchaeia archaeon]|nr:hypothetical protein [Candidatus Nanoarchaeia archaeon]
MTNLEDMAKHWVEIAEEARRINYFQVPKHEDDSRVQELDRRLADFNINYGRPFNFTNAPEGIEAEDYISYH